MFSVKLGKGAVAFETEHAADQIGTLDPKVLESHGWPKEVIDNYRRYRTEHAVALPMPPIIGGPDRGETS